MMLLTCSYPPPPCVEALVAIGSSWLNRRHDGSQREVRLHGHDGRQAQLQKGRRAEGQGSGFRGQGSAGFCPSMRPGMHSGA